MKKYIFKISSLLLFILFSSACHKDLETVYNNKPDRIKVLQNPEDVYSLALGTFYNWYMTVTSSISPRMAMWVMADQGTCSWANSGMYHLSSEPRIGFNNTTSYTYAHIFERYYEDIYGTLFIANNTLIAIQNGMEIGENGKDTEKVKAMGYFIQGLSLGYEGLVYDKGFIITENTDLELELSTSSYQEMLKQAIESLDKCIQICENNSFTVEDTWINGSSYSSEELGQLANSFAARLLVYGSRNKKENDLVDWTKVLNYANKGIQRDLAPYMDNANWKCWYKYYTVRPGWARIDCRIINLMDERYPWRFPDDGIPPSKAQSDDSRLNTDFKYVSTNNMKPERGYYHFSNYEYSRYQYAISVHEGEVVDFSMNENDLFKAEANAELGNLSEAINIINSGSRTSRGGLAPLPANTSKENLMKALFYERDIDLIQTGFGIAFFDMRRRDMLQIGTMLHFPIPAKELMVLGMPEYTFGGVSNADGINVSNGGWFQAK
jgi:hypothetical protein